METASQRHASPADFRRDAFTLIKLRNSVRFLPSTVGGRVLSLTLLVLMAFPSRTNAGTIISTPFGTSYQVNVNASGQNIAGDAANEPSLCIDPSNPNRIAIGWRQFNTTNSSFRPAGFGFFTNCASSWTFAGTLQTV